MFMEAILLGSCAVMGFVVAAFAVESGKSVPRKQYQPVAPRPVARPASPSHQPAPAPRPAPGPAHAGRQVQHRKNGATRPAGAKGAIQDDLIAIVGFSDVAYPILLPTGMSEPGIRKRINQLTSPKYFRGGTTNLAGGMEQALDMLEKSHGRVRRMLVISDGEPNVGVSRLPELAERARRSRVSICTIYAGDGNSPLLQSMADKTRGGWHTTARKMTELACAIRRAGKGAVGDWRSSQRGIMVICIDMSGSMVGDLSNEPGVSRIEACRAAVHGLLDHHGATYGVKVAS